MLWAACWWKALDLYQVTWIRVMPPGIIMPGHNDHHYAPWSLCESLNFSWASIYIFCWTRWMRHDPLISQGCWEVGTTEWRHFKAQGLCWWLRGEESPASAGDMGSIPGLGRSRMPQDNKAMSHNYWACALEPRSCNYGAHVPQVRKPTCLRAHAPQQEKPLQWEARTLQLERSPCSAQFEKSLGSNEDPAQPKRNK